MNSGSQGGVAGEIAGTKHCSVIRRHRHADRSGVRARGGRRWRFHAHELRLVEQDGVEAMGQTWQASHIRVDFLNPDAEVGQLLERGDPGVRDEFDL
jgi:hypothetical protein